MPRMVPHQHKDGQPQEGSALQTWNLAQRRVLVWQGEMLYVDFTHKLKVNQGVMVGRSPSL